MTDEIERLLDGQEDEAQLEDGLPEGVERQNDIRAGRRTPGDPLDAAGEKVDGETGEKPRRWRWGRAGDGAHPTAMGPGTAPGDGAARGLVFTAEAPGGETGRESGEYRDGARVVQVMEKARQAADHGQAIAEGLGWAEDRERRKVWPGSRLRREKAGDGLPDRAMDRRAVVEDEGAAALYQRLRRVDTAAQYRGRVEIAAELVPAVTGAARTSLNDLDRAFQRDARRYDGGFELY